jgi:tRNA A-37 threonylcarbamoyl transferase component Bud32
MSNGLSLETVLENVASAPDSSRAAFAASGLSAVEVLSACLRLTAGERTQLGAMQDVLLQSLFDESVEQLRAGQPMEELLRRLHDVRDGWPELVDVAVDELQAWSVALSLGLPTLDDADFLDQLVGSVEGKPEVNAIRSEDWQVEPDLDVHLIECKVVTRAEWEAACTRLASPPEPKLVIECLTRARRQIGLREEPILTEFQVRTIMSQGAKALKIGSRVLLDLLSEEGMANVYKAWHPQFDRLEVVKSLKLSSSRSRANFAMEARLLSDLAFIDQLPTVYEAAVEDKASYIAMEFIDGHDLRRVVEAQKQLGRRIPFQKAIKWTCELCETLHLAHSHARHVIHRDVKPENIMLANVGGIKLLDLGIASIRSRLDEEESRATPSGLSIGTPRYMPPEQWSAGAHVDRRADIYSLGCCLYYFLTGEDLFNEAALPALEAAHQAGRRPSVDRFRDDIPAGFVEILARMVCPDPAGRFGTAKDAEHALARFLDQEPMSAPSPNEMIANVATAIVGDRAEDPPHTSADILARSVSTGDLTFFGELGLRARVRSHKVAKIAGLEGQRRVLGQDLLVIGSPAVNLVARLVNPVACFRFAITDDAQKLVARFERELEPIKFNRAALQNFLEPTTPEARERIRDLHIMHNQFAKGGFIDPIDYKGLRGERNAHNDFGVVTLGINPFDDSKIVILAAGTGGPGTAAALRLLARPDAFAQHPLGGVFRVEISTEAAWDERYDWLDPKWDTHPYDIADYETSVVALVEQVERSNVKECEGLSRQDAVNMRKLVELLKRRRGQMDELLNAVQENAQIRLETSVVQRAG